MKTKLTNAGKVSGGGIIVCSVAIAVAMITKDIEQGTAKYPLRVSPEFLVEVVGKFEGCRLTKYKDGGGVDTVGIGTTSAVCGKLNKDVYSYEEIAQFFAKGMWEAEQCVNRYFNGLDMPQRPFESLVDVIYNNGCSAVSNNKNGTMTKIRRYALQKKFDDMCYSYMDWVYGRNKSGEKVRIQGLYNRRLADKNWCLKNE